MWTGKPLSSWKTKDWLNVQQSCFLSYATLNKLFICTLDWSQNRRKPYTSVQCINSGKCVSLQHAAHLEKLLFLWNPVLHLPGCCIEGPGGHTLKALQKCHAIVFLFMLNIWFIPMNMGRSHLLDATVQYWYKPAWHLVPTILKEKLSQANEIC